MSYYSLDGRFITIRPTLEQGSIAGVGKPTLVTRGLFKGYSLPIYSADEELFYRTVTPARYDGVTNPTAKAFCYLSGSEDVGDSFKLHLSYQVVDCDGTIVPDTSIDVPVETTITTGHSAQYSIYCVEFPLTATGAVGDLAAGRLRRIATSGTETSNEIVVMYLELKYPINKVYGGV